VRIDGVEAGGDDAGIVEDEDVASLEKIGEVLELTVFDLAGVAMEDEEAGLIAAGGGLLGDQFRGQVVMEIGGSHGGRIAVGGAEG
jgi:hypothetical protein